MSVSPSSSASSDLKDPVDEVDEAVNSGRGSRMGCGGGDLVLKRPSLASAASSTLTTTTTSSSSTSVGELSAAEEKAVRSLLGPGHEIVAIEKEVMLSRVLSSVRFDREICIMISVC